MLKRNLLAYALACALTSTLTAVAGATAASAAPSAPATPSPAVDASIASDPACAAQIAKLRKAKAGTVAVCMSTASGRSTPTLTKKQVLSRASAASPGMSPGNVSAQVQVAEMPDWCFEREHQHNGWWFERNEACETRDGLAEFIFLDIDMPVVLGTIEYQEYNFAFSVIAATWVQQVSIVPTSITEAAVGASVEGLDASCDGSCDPSGTMDFPPQLVSETGVHNGNGQFQSTAVGPGEIGSAISSISYAFTTPEFKEIVAPAVTTMPAIRCDNALPGSGPGCVFPQYIPPLQTGIENPEYSQHLGDALRSGLPGAYPDGTPLHRTTSALIRDLNGAKACPDRYPRPSGKSCDECPFRSTYEGAAVAIRPASHGPSTGARSMSHPAPGRSATASA